MKLQQLRLCELCNSPATLFCPSDNAFLCSTCDSHVHHANFLVARHIRHSICSNSTADLISGQPSCSLHDDDDLDSLSSTTSPDSKVYSRQRSRRESRIILDYMKPAEEEGIFVNWCCKLGVPVAAPVRMAASTAFRVFTERRWTLVLPFRVCLAASMWLGFRLAAGHEKPSWQLLKRLEEISGVPAKLILAAQSKVDRELRRRGRRQQQQQQQLEEGWAEC